MSPNVFIHVANVLLLIAYAARDVLWLRLFAVANAFVAMPYFILQPQPLWVALGWNVVFASINAYQAWRLWLERRPVQLAPEEETVRRMVFGGLPTRKVLQVLQLGTWRTASPGDKLLEEGKLPDAIALIVSGHLQIRAGGMALGDLGPGDIAGSALLLTGEPAGMDAVATEATRVLRWDVPTLQKYLEANPETRLAFQQHLAKDLAGKLHRLGEHVTSEQAPLHH